MRFTPFSIMAMALLAGGCQQATPPKAAAPAAKEQKTPDEPPIAGMEGEDPGASKLLATAAPRAIKPTYIQSTDIPSGTLRGVCRFQSSPSPREKKLPPPKETDISAIKDPQPEESAYYKNCRLVEPLWIQALEHAFVPTNVAVMVKGIGAGKAPAMPRSSFLVERGFLKQGTDKGHAPNNVHFGQSGERLQWGSYDPFTCEMTLANASTQKIIFEGKLNAYGSKEGFQEGPGKYKVPDLLQSPPLHEEGMYRVACKRHPWHKAAFFVVGNPYVAISQPHHQFAGSVFSIEGLPAGKHTLEVFHAEFEPVEKTIEFEIKKDEITDLAIQFKTPQLLK